MRKSGIECRYDDDTAKFHNKVVVVDGRTVVTGSFNLLANAADSNDENLLVIESKAVGGQYAAEFARLWDEYTPGRADVRTDGVEDRPGFEAVVLNCTELHRREHPARPPDRPAKTRHGPADRSAGTREGYPAARRSGAVGHPGPAVRGPQGDPAWRRHPEDGARPVSFLRIPSARVRVRRRTTRRDIELMGPCLSCLAMPDGRCPGWNRQLQRRRHPD